MTAAEPSWEASVAHAQAQLAGLMEGPGSPFLQSSPPGYKRGIDFYRARDLLFATANAVHGYARTQGHLPDLLQPQGFNARVQRRKLVDFLKCPEAGNKLLTRHFLQSSPGDVRCAKVYWHSPLPVLPPNGEVPPGVYHLKASHGSGMNARIAYPLDAQARDQLEQTCGEWLRNPYGLAWGEWWYNAFRPEILLEEDLGPDRLSFNFYCFRGKVALFVVHDKATSETITFMPDFRLVEHRKPQRDPDRLASRDNIVRMAANASAISRDQDFVRVDMFLTDAGEIILAEMTLTPGAGESQRVNGLDRYLGQAWERVLHA